MKTRIKELRARYDLT